MRDRPGHRRGAALPRRAESWAPPRRRGSPGRDLRPDLRQRRRPLDPLGRSAISRSATGVIYPTDLEPGPPTAGRPGAGPDRRPPGRDRDRRPGPEARRLLYPGSLGGRLREPRRRRPDTTSSALFELLSDPDQFARLAQREPRDYPHRPGPLPDAGGQQPLEPRRPRLGPAPTRSTPTARTAAGTTRAGPAGRSPRCS